MKNFKNSKGITLVALIITIIVLLILAVVAISAVQGDGIIAHAKNARDSYQTAQSDENIMLGNYMTELNNANKENNENEKNDDWIAYFLDDSDENNPILKYYANTELSNDTLSTFYIEEVSFAELENYNISIEYISENIELQHFMTYMEIDDDYEYSNGEYDYSWTATPKDKSKTSYKNTIKSSILGQSVKRIDFSDCNMVTDLSNINIPSTVTNMEGSFYNCALLTKIPIIPISVNDMHHCFNGGTPVTTFTYEGTMEQCRLINGPCKSGNTEPLTVICSDGQINID